MRDTIDMAREAGFRVGPSRDGPDDVWGVVANLKRFEALVRANEREACAKVCEDMAKGYEERNARPKEDRDINPEVARIASMTCAFVGDAIRARGQS
jgi:hypothetical protein